ncbi:hypothetical protein [Phenylobacterium sp.]|uniref:hypothetical protein n=1 Tax=Phenylobacterium sp. TaxID=1871053 RepID=UPI0035B387FF
MTATNVTLIVASLILAGALFQPRLLKAELWQATVTPLASIIGSGFLVAGPILAHASGNAAWAAMLGLCAVGYLFGAAIRHNIRYVEPHLAHDATKLEAGLERASELTLSLAYFVSVAYYLNLFAAFGLRVGDIVNPVWIKIAASVVIAVVGTVGLRGGLDALERLEVGAVALKLSLIGGLFVALGFAAFMAVRGGTYGWAHEPHPHGFDEARILLGLVILVQGFETSRYLGAAYDADTRIKTMKWAQWIATGVYLTFMLLITPYFRDGLPAEGGETAIIDMLKPIGTAVGPLIILTALASQLSAAVADMNGAGGLLAEASGRRLKVRLGNLITAVAAIGVTWSGDIYEIITYASKAFVAYYALQCLQATVSAVKLRRPWTAGLSAFGLVLAVIVIVFAVPAEA